MDTEAGAFKEDVLMISESGGGKDAVRSRLEKTWKDRRKTFIQTRTDPDFELSA